MLESESKAALSPSRVDPPKRAPREEFLRADKLNFHRWRPSLFTELVYNIDWVNKWIFARHIYI